MKAASANLLSIIKGPKQFVIPIYQRTYSWQLSQCEQLWKDIIRINSSEDMQGHFIGSVVYLQESIQTIADVPKLLVIDGQQRLTTVSIIIAALANFLHENEDIKIETSSSRLKNYYLLNSEEDGELRYKLLLTRKDKEAWFNIIKGIPQSNDSSTRLYENYQFFYEKICKENIKDVYNGILRLFIVDVALEKDKDNPQLIFESMNSTGLDLSQADLVRNYVLMGQESKLQTELYEKYWYPMEQSYGADYSTYFDRFMRDYLSVKTGNIPRLDQVYETFKIYVNSKQNSLTISDIVKDLNKFSSYYVNIVLHKEKNKELNSIFKQITQLRVDVSYPFILSIYNDFNNGLLSINELYQSVCYVVNYIFRRAICGIPTNSLNKTFVTLYKNIKQDNYLEGVKAALLLLDSYKRFPNDVEFENALLIKDVYNFRNRNYLLSKIENFNRKEFVNVSDYTIEHIMPQNENLCSEWREMLGEDWKEIQATYLHTIGNLTLTGYNSELSDKPFSEKKSMEGGFDDSPIRLNEYLRQTDTWNKEHIEIRAKKIAIKVLQIWDMPKLSDGTIDLYRIKNDDSPVYYIENYEYLKGDMLDLYHALKKRVMNISPSVKEEYKKLYIAFKANTNFVDIVSQKNRLRLSLNVKFSDIIDTKGLCKDVSELGRWGNGEVEVGFSNISELDDVMELVQQSYDSQMG